MPEPNIFNLLFAAVGPGFSLDASKLFPGLDKASKVLKAKGFANKLSGKVAKFFRDLIVAFLTGEPALLESLLPSSLPGFSGAIFLTRGPTEPTLQQFAQGLLTIISLNAGIGVAGGSFSILLFDCDLSGQLAIGLVGDTGIGIGLPNASVGVMFGVASEVPDFLDRPSIF